MNPQEDVHIGSFKIFLESLAYNIELDEQLDVIDYKSEQIGVCNVSILYRCLCDSLPVTSTIAWLQISVLFYSITVLSHCKSS